MRWLKTNDVVPDERSEIRDPYAVSLMRWLALVAFRLYSRQAMSIIRLMDDTAYGSRALAALAPGRRIN